MSVPSRTLLMAALAAAVVAGAAQAKVAGQCSYEGRKVALVDGSAWLLPVEAEDEDEYDDGEPAPGPEVQLVFTTFKLDLGALQRAANREDAARDQSWEQDESARLQLTLQDGAITQQYLWISPGTNLSYSSSEVGHYTPGKAAAGQVAGQYRFSPEDGQDLDCELAFTVALLGDASKAPPPPGQPLPAGGGEAGKAYLALNAAMLAGDLDKLQALLPPGQAAEMKKSRNSPDFAAQLAMMQAMTPSKVRITGGRQDGDQAWLEFTAVEAGQPRAGTAEMARESGRWVLKRESTRDP